MALNKAVNNVDERGDKPAQKAREGLKFPLGNAHWENKAEDTMVGDLRYASEMNTSAEYKKSVDALAKYTRTHKAEH
jgi:hypothetical protein